MAPNIAKITKQFVRLNIANFAFYQVKCHAQHMLDSNFAPDDPLLTPHFAGLVVTYTKNFTESEGMGPLPEMFADFPPGIMRHTHHLLMEARHKLYAHRDVTASKTFAYDDPSPSQPYELAIEISKESGITCYPNVPELSPEILRHVIDLCVYQNGRVIEEFEKMLPILTQGKKYKEGVRYVVGVDFP